MVPEKYIRTSLSFEHLIDDPGWMPYFLDFLSQHNQSHLLLFWLEVEVFELAAGGGPSLVVQGSRIYDSYLSPESPKKLDLPESIVSFIQAELSTAAPNVNIFAAAHAYVFRRLKQTWYPAFILSSTYQSLLEHLKKSFGTPLKDILMDEVHSRYLETFLLNESQLSPATVGNIYLWKKIHHDLRPLGARVARDLQGDRTGEDILLFITDAKSTYEAFIQPPPQSGIPGGPPLSIRSSPMTIGVTPSATCLSPELRHRIADCLGRLIGQFRYYTGSGVGSIVSIDRALVKELSTHWADAQRVILTWLEMEVFPSFKHSWLCGVLSGYIQARSSAPLRRRKRLKTLFKSVRSFRHVYVPPCPRSEGRGLVLVSTEHISGSPDSLQHEFIWGFDIAVAPLLEGRGRNKRPILTAEDLRRSSSGDEEEKLDSGEEEEEGPDVGDNLTAEDDHQHEHAVGGAVVSCKIFDEMSDQKMMESPGSRKTTEQPIRFRSQIRSSQVLALDSPSATSSFDDGAKDLEELICQYLAARVKQEIQRLVLPSLCLLPLEKSTFVLFSPKLIIPEPTIHHFILPIHRKKMQEEISRRTGGSSKSVINQTCESKFVQSPRSSVPTPDGDGLLEPPDLSADEYLYLYGTCLMEWSPGAADEVLLPRCLSLISTESRMESMREVLLAVRGRHGRPSIGGSPISSSRGESPAGTAATAQDPWREQLKREGACEFQEVVSLLGETRKEEKVGDARAYWRSTQSSSRFISAALSPKGNTDGRNAAATAASSSSGGQGQNWTAAATLLEADSSTTPLPSLLLQRLPKDCDVSFLPVFQCMSPETFTKALTAVLLERPLIIKSSSRTLLFTAAEALRSLIYPFSWLRSYHPLLPVSSICSFWHEIRQKMGGRTWFDYFFEDDALDDSLVKGANEGCVEPVSASSSRIVPGFIVGLESCIVDAALSATKAVSPAYRDTSCHAWACSTCEVHEGGWGGDHALLDSMPSPLSTRRPPPSTRSIPPASTRSGNISSSRGSSSSSSSTKYGELPDCIKNSTRELLSFSFVLDLDNDRLTETSRGDPTHVVLPCLPETAASTLLTNLQRVVNPIYYATAAGGPKYGYGYRAVLAARESWTSSSSSIDTDKLLKKRAERKLASGDKVTTTPLQGSRTSARPTTNGSLVSGTSNALLHSAFVGFFREILLDRYREFTLSYMEEQMVAFNTDSFLAAQPESTHAFWVELFQTRLFAHFLYLEHDRVARSFTPPQHLGIPAASPKVMDV